MLLTDEEIIAAGYNSGDPEGLLEFGRGVEAAVLAKLREQKPPIAWMMCGDTEGSDLSDEAFSWDKNTSTGHVIPVFTHSAPSTPEGMVLAPVEPTLDMGWAYLDAAREATPDEDHVFSHPGYRAMLAAARSGE